MKKLTSLLLILCLLTALPALADDDDRTITVSGSATVYMEADIATLILGVRIKNPNLSQAQSESANRIAAVTAVLQQAGIQQKDIATADYSIYNMTEYAGDGIERQYYQVNHTLNITVRDIGSIGSLIDQAVKAGANSVDSISFSSQKLADGYEPAMKDALADGRSKAEILCEAAGVHLGKVRTISFQPAQYGAVSNSRSYKMAGGEMDEAASTVIQSGSVSVSASVTLVYELED